MDEMELIGAIERAGYQARDYSGRGMYGKLCVAFTTCGGLFHTGVKIADALNDAFAVAKLAELHVETDSMGRDTVVYFPGVPWPEGYPRTD